MYYRRADIKFFKTYDHELVHLISSNNNTKPLQCSNHKPFPTHTVTLLTEYVDGPLQRYNGFSTLPLWSGL
jgi:hypothetical protein